MRIPTLPWRRLLVALVAVSLAAVPAAVRAATATNNYLRADVSAAAGLVDMYAYGTGTAYSTTTQADFAAGTLVDTSATIVADSLTLDRAVSVDPDLGLAGWWDTDWITRQCFVVDHTAAGASNLVDYPIRLTPALTPTSQLRAVADDDLTVLPHWVNGPEVWVKVDLITAGSSTHLCLYQDNPAATDTSDVTAAVLSALRPAYVTVNEQATGRSVAVVSYTDGNVVSTGTETVYGLDAGESYTFATGITDATTISTLGPIASRVIGQAADTLVPLSWAGTEFIFPTTRGAQRFSVHAPGGDASVTFYRGSIGSTVALLVPAGTTQSVNADGGGRAVVVTSDQPVLVSHVGISNRDAYAAYPATTDDLFGVPSTRHYLSTNTDGTGISVYRSNGTSPTYTINQFQRLTVAPNSATYGNGPAVRVAGTSPIGSIQQADGNGIESSTFLPAAGLSDRYYLPTQATYVAFACPTPGTVIDVIPPSGAPTALTCAGPALPFPGKARAGVTPTGTLFRSQGGEAFYAYYQDNATVDETNLLGPVAGALAWPAPATPAARPVSGVYRSSGQWTSPTFDTTVSGVFGLLDWSAVAPPSTALSFQIATAADAVGPFTFVGPDGTPATYYTHPGPGSDILDYSHDGNRYGRVQAVLSTADPLATPRVDDIAVEADLAALAMPIGGSSAVSVLADADGFHHLVRVRTAGLDHDPSMANLTHVADSNLANLAAAEIAIDAYPGPQLEYAGGAVITPSGPPQPFSPPAAYSITLSESTVTAGQATVLDVTWRLLVSGTAGTYIDRPLEVTVNS